ncbi:MAG TPA: T9SS type A sorting domain-containing protein [Flavobacteriaceae bacterium]|nr:T9SS type A sorting domain-containing protein [Flavobacteriaceae bacterium]
MKKITYLLALFLVAQTSLFAQYTAVPDATLEAALASYDDISSDGQVPTAAMEAETGTLYLGSLAITNFTGIEAFINLTELDIEYNTVVTSLDVSALTALTRLDIEGCSSLTSITMPGAGSQLDILEANDAALTSIDLSNNVLLETLNIHANQLVELDLSLNTALTSVICTNQGSATTLTSLDMRNGTNATVYVDSDSNNNLTCIFVDDDTEPNLGTWSIDINSNFVENQGECDLLGTDDKVLTAFSMYPNPARGSVSILSKTQSSKLEVYSITGKLVLTKELSYGENSVGLTSLSSGVYLARFTSENRSETKKLIVN